MRGFSAKAELLVFYMQENWASAVWTSHHNAFDRVSGVVFWLGLYVTTAVFLLSDVSLPNGLLGDRHGC